MKKQKDKIISHDRLCDSRANREALVDRDTFAAALEILNRDLKKAITKARLCGVPDREIQETTIENYIRYALPCDPRFSGDAYPDLIADYWSILQAGVELTKRQEQYGRRLHIYAAEHEGTPAIDLSSCRDKAKDQHET